VLHFEPAPTLTLIKHWRLTRWDTESQAMPNSANTTEASMTKGPEKLNELNQKATEAALKLTRLSMEQGERLMKLQLEAVRGMIDDSMKSAKSLMEARDPQQWSALHQKNMQGMLARMTEYSRSVQDIAGKTQKEIGELVESRASAMNAQFQSMVDEMAKSAPPGSESAVAAMKQVLAAANSLAGTMTETAQQFAKSAESAVKVAAETAAKGGKGG
jgi:phasin family protein